MRVCLCVRVYVLGPVVCYVCDLCMRVGGRVWLCGCCVKVLCVRVCVWLRV